MATTGRAVFHGGLTMSFFEWVREGVRQAVVLGLADAIDDVGTRSRDEDMGAKPQPNPQLCLCLRLCFRLRLGC